MRERDDAGILVVGVVVDVAGGGALAREARVSDWDRHRATVVSRAHIDDGRGGGASAAVAVAAVVVVVAVCVRDGDVARAGAGGCRRRGGRGVPSTAASGRVGDVGAALRVR